MKSLVLLGIGGGLGVVALAAGMLRRRPSELTSKGKGLTKLLRLSGAFKPLHPDLAVLGRSEESLAVATALGAIAGGSAPAIVYTVTEGLGLRAPISLLPVVCVVVGGVGAATPSLLVRRAAVTARQDLVRSLGCWLELVALAQAGGMGIESALEAASSVAGEASFLRIRRALDRARHAGRSPWEALGQLGAELGVNELEELAASLRLAGTEGARIRASLSAKSASLRRRQLADAQGRANATTERLFLPAIVLMLGFVVFLMYPAGVTLSRVL